MCIKDRILQIIASKGLSRRKFYQSIGVSSGFLSKNQNIGSDKLKRILNEYPDISINWLVFGTGNMLQEDNKPASSYLHTLPVVDVSNIVNEPATDYQSGQSQTSNVKVLDTISLGKNFENCSAAVQIWGDSMEPTFFSGDIAILRQINNFEYLQWGYAHLIVTQEQRFFKFIQNHPTNKGSILLETGNKSYESFELSKKEILHVFEARGLIRKLML